MKPPKEYTPWRRFLAWVGFITLLLAFPAIITLAMWGTDIVNIAIHDAHANVDGRQALIAHCAAIGGEAIYDANYQNLIECDITL